MSQYIGKTISLVSVTDNRYVGLLEGIDSDKGTVTLQNVRCFGTEGRKNWGPEEIYPNPTVYKSVKFNGNEVKDLSILDVKLDEVQPVLPPRKVVQASAEAAQQPVSQQPASQQPASQQQPQQQPQQQQQRQVPAAVAGYGVYAPEPSSGRPTEAAPAKASYTPQHAPAPRREEHHTRVRNDEQRRQPPQNRKVEIPKEDYDFQSSNAKFTKDGAENVDAEETEPTRPEFAPNEDPDHFYNKKSSFFDSISTSTESSSNIRWQEEKAMNLDTFGQASARPRFGRGGQRGGRGGRGRGRGRGGRGGFQNRSNFNQNDNQQGQQPPSQRIEF